jgi:predicted small secreted protein
MNSDGMQGDALLPVLVLANLTNNRRLIMIKRLFALLLTTLFLAGTAASLTGCNTVAGAGKDIERGGAAIKDEANEHK